MFHPSAERAPAPLLCCAAHTFQKARKKRNSRAIDLLAAMSLSSRSASPLFDEFRTSADSKLAPRYERARELASGQVNFSQKKEESVTFPLASFLCSCLRARSTGTLKRENPTGPASHWASIITRQNTGCSEKSQVKREECARPCPSVRLCV